MRERERERERECVCMASSPHGSRTNSLPLPPPVLSMTGRSKRMTDRATTHDVFTGLNDSE